MKNLIKEIIEDHRRLMYLPHWGPRTKQGILCLLPSIGVFAAAAVLNLIYFTEWKAVTQKIPLYNSKYEIPEVEDPRFNFDNKNDDD